MGDPGINTLFHSLTLDAAGLPTVAQPAQPVAKATHIVLGNP
jgi:hypothetical protein